jgi:hypothetical protein
MDHNVPMAITRGLRRRGVDVLTAQDAGTTRLPDPDLLDHATALNRVLFTQDDDLLREAARRQQSVQDFAGVIYVHQQSLTIGQRITDLEIMAKVLEPKDMLNQVKLLPL